MRLLLIQGGPALSDALPVLKAHGFHFDVLCQASDAARALDRTGYDAVVLDRTLPNQCGLAWLREQRGAGLSLPVVVVVPADDMEERIAALDAGADDCVPRQVHGRELLARLRAVLRRPPALSSPVLSAGNVRLDVATREVWVGGQPVAIPRRELSLLEHLMRRCGRVVPRPALEGDLYGHLDDVCPNSIEVRISRVRRHMQHAEATVSISTVRGVGYMLAAMDEARSTAQGGAPDRPAMAS